MNPSSAPTCPKCHAVLPTDAPAGLCPRCMMALNFTGDTVTDGASRQPAPTPEELAPHFPQLEIIECLGRGGMGVVYKARQTSLGRLVALKLLAPERVGDAKFAERFAQEAKALAALNHPNIVTIHDFGQAGGFFYLLMEFVDGVNLRQAMQVGRFTPEQALAVVPPVCEALQYAHEHGIVHRDIKPENLLLDKDGRVKIADFGVAKMLGEQDGGVGAMDSQPAGTPQYMAPEQKEHRRTDHRADIYSLGVVLYELLTGELPAGKLQPPSRKVQIDVRLDEIVLRALEKTPELRFQTAGEFRTQVLAATDEMHDAAAPAGYPPGTASSAAAVAESASSRFSRTAIIGACWIPFFFLAFVGMFFRRSVPAAEYNGPAWWQIALMVTLVPLGATAPFGTTILGWIAVAQIRRSAGRLYGMWLAVFDGLLVPLAGLIWLIACSWWWLIRVVLEPAILAGQRPLSLMERIFVDHTGAFMVIATFVTALVAGFFIVRAVWRAVNGSATGGGEGVPGNSAGRSGVTSPPTARTMSLRPAASSIALAVLLLLLGILIPVVGIPMHNNSVRAASADHMKYIRSLQEGVTSVSEQIGEANTVAGRAAVRAGNGAEREETRAQAREDRRTYQQRSASLKPDLKRLYAALAVAGNKQVDPHSWRAVSILVAGFLLAIAGVGMLVAIQRRSGAGTHLPPPIQPVRAPFKYATLLLLIPVLFIGILFVKFTREGNSPSGVTSFDVKPVEVRGNVVVVDVTTEVARGNAELRAVLDGRRLPVATEAALADAFSPPFAGTFVKPAPHGGNHPWFILSPGRQTQRLGFVLPDAAAAKVAFDNLRPIGPLPAVAGRTVAGTLFALQQSEGEDYRASLQVAPPLTAADPNWVSVTGSSQSSESAVTLTWEVLASQPGLAQFSRAGSPIKTLLRNPQTNLYGVSAKLELTKMGADRVRFVRRLGHSVVREEFSGNLRDLADELLRTKTVSAKTVAGTVVELCQFQGKPFTVQVQTQGGPSTTSVFAPLEVVKWTGPSIFLLLVGIVVVTLVVVLARKGVSAGKIVLLVIGVPLLLAALIFAVLAGSYAQLSTGAGHSRFSWIGLLAIGAVILLIIAAGITLLVVLLRKGGSAGKIAGFIVGGLLLLLAIAVAVIPAVRRISRDFGPGATVVQLPQPPQSSGKPGAAPLEKPLIDGSLPDARILVYAATGIEHGWVQIQARLDADHELAFFLGEEGSGWSDVWRFGEKGDYQSFIEKSDAIALENGGKGRGFLIRSGPGGESDRAKSIAYVSMEPGGSVPAGELTFRTRELNVTDNTTRITFADIVTPDGQRIPMSARVRPRTEAAQGTSAAELEAREKDHDRRVPAPVEVAAGLTVTPAIPEQIDFKVLRVENPPGTRDILLHFERDTNYGLAIEVWQDVTASPDGKAPKEGYRTWQQKTWVGLNGGRVLGWTLPQEFTEAEATALAREIEQKWKGSHPLPDGAVPEFATALHRDGWKYHLVTKVLREPGSPRPPAPAGALFTAEQRINWPADALARVTLAQSAKDGPKTNMGDGFAFKTAANRATGFTLRWHAYPAQQGKFGNQWILDLVDPDTGAIFHRIENRFAMPVKLTSPDVPPLPRLYDAVQLGDSRTWIEFQLLRAEEQPAPGAALTAWWDVFATVDLPSDRPVPAFQMAPKP